MYYVYDYVKQLVTECSNITRYNLGEAREGSGTVTGYLSETAYNGVKRLIHLAGNMNKENLIRPFTLYYINVWYGGLAGYWKVIISEELIIII